MARNRIETERATLSGRLFGRKALTMPTGSPTSHEISTDTRAISALSGPRRSSLGARDPDVVPAHDVVDAEERGGVLAVNAIMPTVVDLFVRDGQERRVVLENLLGLTHHGLAPALVHLALDLTREVVEG